MKLRFAPSPTGYLHIGNARLAIANALFAAHNDAQLQLRIDDTDTTRSKDEYVKAIKEEMHWLGISWDEYFHQSERTQAYHEAIEKLKKEGRLYPCFETEQELLYKRKRAIQQKRPPIYDRAMLRMTEEQKQQALANGKKPYWRFKLSGKTVTWHDHVMGDCTVRLNSVSDPVLIRADGTLLYTLASVVDDLQTKVTHIIRGADHVTNTGIQIDLAHALGAQGNVFEFAHLPMLMDKSGVKFSKRLAAVSLRQMRRDGICAEPLVAYLARLGSKDNPELNSFSWQAQHYDLSHISRSAARFDMHQLLSLNHKYLSTCDYEHVKDHLPKGADETFWKTVQKNIELLSQTSAWYQIIHGDLLPPEQIDENDFLKLAAEHLPDEPWNNETWSQWTHFLKEKTGRKGRKLFHPLRVALTGEENGPELKNLLPLIGKKSAQRRLLCHC